jgi:hypothetical protein
MITDIPLGGNYVGHRVVFDGRPVPIGAEPAVQTLSVMGDYFHVMQIPVRVGRPFTPMDREGQPLRLLIDAALHRVGIARRAIVDCAADEAVLADRKLNYAGWIDFAVADRHRKRAKSQPIRRLHGFELGRIDIGQLRS